MPDAQSSTRAMRRLFAGLDYPLYAVTTSVAGEPTGCLVGFATQCSIHPSRFLVCISKLNHTFRIARQAEVFAVHLVDQSNKAIAELFGGESGDVTDKFSKVRWRLVHGAPVLDDCSTWFVGRIIDRFDLGDHVGHLLDPVAMSRGIRGPQLTLHQAKDIHPGHPP